MNVKKYLCLLVLVCGAMLPARSQNVAIKTNLIGDALLNANLGVEIGLAPKWTLELPASLNKWVLDDGARWKHWYVQPAARYWFCDRFSGHFLGIHTHGGQYNVGGVDWRLNPNILDWGENSNFSKLKDTRFQGWFVGAGISYGYAWILGTHWNLEAEIGVGYVYTRYDQFRCTGCGKRIQTDQPQHYVGPTKAAINLVYLF